MPSEKILQQKQQYVGELSDKIKGSVSGVVVSYKGISVADDTKLRRQLREAGVEYAVVKNTMLRRAADMAEIHGLDPYLEGTTALAISADHVAPAKVISKFAETNKFLEIKAGYIEGKTIDADAVKELAKMPTKEVLVAKALGGLNAPIANFAYVLNANLQGLVIALNAIAQKQDA